MAFNIDIELGLSPRNRKVYRIYCATLTERWEVDRSPADVQIFSKRLVGDKSIESKIPLPKQPPVDDRRKVEIYLSRLACLPATLRFEAFQDFLNVPKQIRGGLAYVSEKPFGKAIKTGPFQVHARNVKMDPPTRWFELTLEGKSSNLLMFEEANAKAPMAVLKLAASSKMAKLDELKNSVVLQSGKRQWVIQCKSSKTYKDWYATFTKCMVSVGADVGEKKKKKGLKSFGQSIKRLGTFGTNSSHEEKQKQEEQEKRRKEFEELRKKNKQLRVDIGKAEEEMEGLRQEIDGMEHQKEELKVQERKFKEEKMEEFRRQMEALEDKHTERMEKLRMKIEELHQRIEEKNRKEGFLKVGLLFSDGFDKQKDTDVQVPEASHPTEEQLQLELKREEVEEESEGNEQELDETGEVTDVQREETSGAEDYNRTYKNLHKHTHLHILHHRHTHYHDDTVQDEVVFTHTQTLAHTIVHTSTQFKIQKRIF